MANPTSGFHRRTLVGPRDAPPSRCRGVLVVDSDTAVVHAVVRALGERGYRVLGMRDADVVIQDRSNSGNDRGLLASTDLLITELAMDRVSGLDLIRHVRTNWSIPVIGLSVFADPALRERALELGAVAVLHKPFYLDELVDLVRRLTSPEPRA